MQVWEPILLLGAQRYSDVDIRIRVKGGGYTSQIYAIRQAIAKALVAWYQKCKDTPATLYPSTIYLILLLVIVELISN